MRYENNFTIDQVREFWDSVAPVYEKSNAKINHVHDQRYRVAVTLIKPASNLKVLNLWSRAGRSLSYFRPVFGDSEIVNLEASDRLRELAMRAYPDEKFGDSDLENIAFPDDYFDRIISLETLEHSPKPFKLICSFHRVLKCGGRAVISLPPPTAEIALFIYELFAENHGEGPHHFLSYQTVSKFLHEAGLRLLEHHATLFLPFKFGPAVCLNDQLEKHFKALRLRDFGLRHFYVVEK